MLLALAAAAALASAPPDPEVDRLRGVMALAHGHGGVMYELAQALARAGQAEEAVRWVKDALDQGLDLDLGQPAFASLRDRDDWKEQLARAEALKPVSTSRVAFRIPEKDLIPEGIAWDANTGDFFVGSLHKKKIVRVDREGRVHDFKASGQDGLEDVLGLKVDPERRTLWAATAATGRAGQKAGRSGLLAFDIDSGRLRRSVWLDNADGRHFLNDMALAASGEVLATDSDAGTLWRLAPDASGLEVVVGPGTFLYPNGLVLSADGQRLYVADFKHGLSVVDLASRVSRPLPHPDGTSTSGIDGLARDGGDLLAIQNAAGRERVLRYHLDPKGERVERVSVLESRNPLFRAPTTGVVAEDEFVYIANANLDALDEQGSLKKDAHLEEVVVLRSTLR